MGLTRRRKSPVKLSSRVSFRPKIVSAAVDDRRRKRKQSSLNLRLICQRSKKGAMSK